MVTPRLHRFEEEGKRFAIDPETCFCFECDPVSWEVLEDYPGASVARIARRLEGQYPVREIEEVVGELEWLRSCKSILPTPTAERLQKQYEVDYGLRVFHMMWPSGSIREVLPSAMALFLGRARAQKQLQLYLELPSSLPSQAELEWACHGWFSAAGLAGKTAQIVLRISMDGCRGLLKSLLGHNIALAWSIAHPEAMPKALAGLCGVARGVWPKATQVPHECEVVLCPGQPRFADAVRDLAKAGFPSIFLDMDAAMAAHAPSDPAPWYAELRATASFYAEELRAHHYFRLEPMASLFHRIYQGQPLSRHDTIGLNELAATSDGVLYPSRLFRGMPDCSVGDMKEFRVNEEGLHPFEDVGSLTTSGCIECWARNLCGGGCAAIHQVYTGSYRRPHPPWCEAQRGWMAGAVAAFSRLSTDGIDFSRMMHQLTPAPKPSWRNLLRAAFRMHIGLRPIAESDAEWLAQWENWNESAYFLFHESGLLLATQYDREMDSLHPPGYETEFVLVHRNGNPFGLLKLRPERIPGTAMIWLFFRAQADYDLESVRDSFRFLLRETAQQQHIRRVLCPAGPADGPLKGFLAAVGFSHAGTLRQALFLHDRYHDVSVFSYTFDT